MIAYLFLCLSVLQVVKAQGCPSLPRKSGVIVECVDYETNALRNCSRIEAIGTVAKFKCSKYYTSPFGDNDGGKVTCDDEGKWVRRKDYDEFSCRIDCGKPTVALLSTAPVVVFGDMAAREGFPWHASIFRRNGPGTPFQYFCGGSLIHPSKRGFLVLTAAHCVTRFLRTQKVRPVEDFRVVFGAISSDFEENIGIKGVQIFTVTNAKAHPNYNYDNLQNDIAFMQLKEKPRLTEYLMPVCFPKKEMANKEIKGTGMVAGFGVDESTTISQQLNYARLPVVENYICNKALDKELTSVEFCAGYSKGTSVCSGDSGGGLVFMDELSKRLYVQGITSNVDTRPLQQKKYCQNYNTFTRVSSFVDWILDEVEEINDINAVAASNANKQTDKKPPRPGSPVVVYPENFESFVITVYEDINDKGRYKEWRMQNCSALPAGWNNGEFWVDLHGKCVQFFEGSLCSGRSLQLQSTSQSSIFRWNFPDYIMRTASLCKDVLVTPSPPRPTTTTTPRPPPPTARPPQPINPTPRPPQPVYPGGGGGGNNNYDFERTALQAHNYYRAKHGSPPLRLNSQLSQAASYWADKLIRQNHGLQASNDGGGENLYEITNGPQDNSNLVQGAVDLWYSYINQYNWNNPTASSFSQVVWRATTDIGIGIARNGRRTVVVAKYSPAGNVYYYGPNADRAKYFRDNVQRPR